MIQIFTVLMVWFAAATAAVAKPSADERLTRFLDGEWRYQMHEFPEYATAVGYPGQNDRWTDYSAQAIAARKDHDRKALTELESIDRSQLSEEARLNFDLYRRDLGLSVRGQKFPSELIPITQMGGVQESVARNIASMPARNHADYLAILQRLRLVPTLIDQNIALMKAGLERGITPPKITLAKVKGQIEAQLEPDLTKNPLFRPFTEMPKDMAKATRSELEGKAKSILQTKVIPAFKKLHQFFVETYEPKARASIALSALPDGASWYAYQIEEETTTTKTAEEIHAIGQKEVERIRHEMEKIKDDVGFKGDLKAFFDYLRTDKKFYFSSAEELLEGYRDIAKRADFGLISLFKTLPRLPYGVLPVPGYFEKAAPTAYYEPGSIAAGRSGAFYANTYDLSSRPKWEMEALTLHEAVPGHHLQVALAQEEESLPEFRRNGGYTAYVEGWGLYAESLGERLGFYKDPYAKFGQLTYEMWRAIRLVVDTGMHALGWSREQAIQFFQDNAGKAKHDIEVEVDRYIAWPGQALAYKLGELKIKELRAKAERELGAKFDLRAFHDEILSDGALPLDVLDQKMTRWIMKEKGLS